jgi:hypothetical protein
MEVTPRFNIGDVITISTERRRGMKKCIDKAAIGNILHKLWKKDTGYENIDIARIAYNRALQDVQKAIDSKQEEPVSEELGEIIIEGANFNKSWYAHPELAFKAGEFRGRQFGESVSEDLEKAAKQYSFYIPTQCEATETWKKETEQHFIDGAKWHLAKIKSITLDDLEKFINELSKQFPEVSFAKVCKIATRTAKWLLDVKLPKLEED